MGERLKVTFNLVVGERLSFQGVGLHRRESEILAKKLELKQAKQIAYEMDITKRTVETHIGNIFEKTHFRPYSGFIVDAIPEYFDRFSVEGDLYDSFCEEDIVVSFSPRVREVFLGIVEAKTAKEIAASLGIGDRTIQLHSDKITNAVVMRKPELIFLAQYKREQARRAVASTYDREVL